MGGTQSSVNNNNSVFGHSLNAEDIAKHFESDCTGKYIIVTGGNSGVGLEAARVLAVNGASVVLCSRSVKNGDKAIAKIKNSHPNVDITTMQLDLASFKSIYAFVASYKATNKPLNLLINNAGVMACPKTLTEDGFESQFGVNHLGHFMLTTELLPLLISSGKKEVPSRVINLSSCGNWQAATLTGIRFNDLDAKMDYNPFQRYGDSKLANILFSNELNRRMKEGGFPVISIALHPGIISSTNLTQHMGFSAISAAVTLMLTRPGVFGAVMSEKAKTIPQGASTTVYCALSPDVIPGEYYSDCAVSLRRHAQCVDQTAWKRLWEVSEQLIQSKK